MSTATQRAHERLARARAQLAKVEPPYFSRARVVKLLALLLVLDTLLAGLWTFTTTIVLQSDPLLGAHASMVCADVCDDCVGPYVFEETTTLRGSAAVTDALYCTDADRHLHAVQGGIWYVGLTTMVGGLPLSFALVVVLVVLGRRSYLTRRRDWRKAVDEAEQALAEPAPGSSPTS